MANVRVTSFQKRGRNTGVVLRGTRPSFQNSQLLLSSGVPSIDSLIGGGYPVGSLVLIDEDAYGTFSKLLMKYYIAEGVLSSHAVFLGSLDVNPEHLVSELPGPVIQSSAEDKSSEIDGEMKIAWRYKNLKSFSSAPSASHQLGHFFDLTMTLDEEIRKKAKMNLWSGNENTDKSFKSLFASVNEALKEGKFLIQGETQQTNLLRIGLLRLGSPLWNIEDLPRFLYSLRALIRNSFASCVITVPFHLHENKSIVEKCIHICDIAIKLESFTGTKLEKNESLREYHGFFNIVKHAAINSLLISTALTSDLAFRLKRKKLIIEKIHLPPELEGSTEREQDDVGSVNCSSARSSKLDF